MLDEMALPVTPQVRAAAELLGIDPLHVANEGKAVLGVRPDAAETVLEALRGHPPRPRRGDRGRVHRGTHRRDRARYRLRAPPGDRARRRAAAEDLLNGGRLLNRIGDTMACELRIVTDTIHTRIEEAVGYITIDRPERFNSLDVRTAQDLRRAGLMLARDDAASAWSSCRAARRLLQRRRSQVHPRGRRAPRISAISARKRARRRPATASASSRSWNTCTARLPRSAARPKPFIAAVDGMAAAGGFGLAMCCDLVFASERAVFEWAYSKTGLTGAESSTFMLPRLIGFRRAMELVLLNPRLDAETGVAARPDQRRPSDARRSTSEVQRIARTVADGPADAFAVAKGLINQAAGMDRLDVHLDRELEHLAPHRRRRRVRRRTRRLLRQAAGEVPTVTAMHEYSHRPGPRRARRGGSARPARHAPCTGCRFASVSCRVSRWICLTTAYATFRERTICERAELDVQMVAARWECPGCGSAIGRGIC